MRPVARPRGRKADGTPFDEIDPCGAVFVPDPERRIGTPVFSYGHGEGVQAPVFTCPVSAVPPAVWRLLDLFLTCRAMHALPCAGGVLDQPRIVRRAFPIFEMEMQPIDRQADQMASMSVVTTMMATLFGKR